MENEWDSRARGKREEHVWQEIFLNCMYPYTWVSAMQTALMKSSPLMEGIITTVRLFHPTCLPRVLEECRQSSKALVIVEVNDSAHGRVKRVPLGFLSPLSRASSMLPVPSWLCTRRIPLFPSVHGQANWLCWMSIWTSDPLILIFSHKKQDQN